ncbi:hypothetical protein BDY19DRAFT_923734, partial [Irpex rosettiformis]
MKKQGLSVSVTVDGVQAEEYAVQEPDDKTMSCHIASEVGKMFSVKVSNKGDSGFFCHLYVDGSKVKGVYSYPRRTYVARGITSDDQLSYKPFKFGALKTTDDESALNSTLVNLQDLGTLRVECFRAERVRAPHTGSSNARPRKKNLKPNFVDIAVHEKTKKLGGHVTELGDTMAYIGRSRGVSNAVTRLLDPRGSPCLQFTIHYLPKDILEAQDIIPRSVPRRERILTPSQPGPSKRRRIEAQEPPVGLQLSRDDVVAKAELEADETDLTLMMDEAAELEASLAAKRADIELKRLSSQQRRRMKREQPPIHVAEGLQDEVIDLTLDD